MPKNEGWWWPLNARKPHYMRDGRSLCGKWMTLGQPDLQEDNGPSDNDCAGCRRVLDGKGH